MPDLVERCAHGIIEERIDIQLHAPAICAWDGKLTYDELGRFATELASRLVQLGLGTTTGRIVPLCFEKSMWTSVAMLGVLKAGGTFVLLDPYQPEFRLQSVVKQVEASIVLSSTTMIELSSRLAPQTITVSSTLFTCAERSVKLPITMPSHDSAAYIAFTSGSTGEPKGALISHANIASALHHQQHDMGFSTKTRFYDFSSYSFDASIGIFFTTLAAGGCICVPSDEDRKDNLIESIVSLNANTLDLTPSVAALLSIDVVPCLETLILGGEAIKVGDVGRWWNKVRIVTFYGPCECTPTTTVNGDAKTPEDAIHLGKGSGLVTWLVDPENYQSLIPIGAVGELLLEGPLVGLGYLKDEEKTAEAFIEDPEWLLAGVSGYSGRHGRLYKTGDLVRYREDGGLSFVGRKDSQVKIRGQRIELGEIEEGLRKHAGVKDAIAVVQQDEQNGNKWISAFVTLHKDQSAFREEASVEGWERRLARDHLPTNGHVTKGLEKRSIDDIRLRDCSDQELEETSRWLASILNPMYRENSAQRFESLPGPEFALFCLPADACEKMPEELQFISKIVDATTPLDDRITLLTTIPSKLGPYCATISSGLLVLNSVTQFFPSQAYLLNVVKEALKLQSIRTIVFGDVRSNILYRESLVEGATRLYGDSISQGDLEELAAVPLDKSQLLINPEFFTGLIQKMGHDIDHVEIVPDDSRSERELGALRYSAILHIQSSTPKPLVQQIKPEKWIDFENLGMDSQSLTNLLKEHSDESLLPITNIPYRRVADGKILLQLLQDAKEKHVSPRVYLANHHASHQIKFLSVGDLLDVAGNGDCNVQISWVLQGSQAGNLSAIFHRQLPDSDNPRYLFSFGENSTENTAPDKLCSKPRRITTSERAEVELREMLSERLPLYMVPRAIKVLDHMPLNNNCKIDRKALSQMLQQVPRHEISESANGELSESEKIIRQIWGNTLVIEPHTIGRHDRFFDIGGDSISAMKVVLEARRHNFAITVRDVFLLEVHEMAQRLPVAAAESE